MDTRDGIGPSRKLEIERSLDLDILKPDSNVHLGGNPFNGMRRVGLTLKKARNVIKCEMTHH